jgi:hypothetical protein
LSVLARRSSYAGYPVYLGVVTKAGSHHPSKLAQDSGSVSGGGLFQGLQVLVPISYRAGEEEGLVVLVDVFADEILTEAV